MTWDEILGSEKEILTCADVAPLLGANPATIHGQAMEWPEMLGFPVIVAGRRVKIPRRAFIKFMEGESRA